MVTVVSILVLLAAVVCAIAKPLRSSGELTDLIRFSDLWKWSGTVDRRRYAFVGVVGFAIKHNIDRIVATVFFGRQFTPWNYWNVPVNALRIDLVTPADRRFIITLALIALSFLDRDVR